MTTAQRCQGGRLFTATQVRDALCNQCQLLFLGGPTRATGQNPGDRTAHPNVETSEIDRLAEQIYREMLARFGPPSERRFARDQASASPKLSFEQRVASLIDHTLLRPDATREQIEELCRQALHFGFASACVNPVWAPVCAKLLHGSGVRVCTVVGFPLGATLTEVKRFETGQALKLGAEEIDMVIPVGALRSGDLDRVYLDILGVVEAARAARAVVKVIIEAGLLNDSEKIAASTLAMLAGADFVKTSTGFGPSGATVRDVEILRRVARGAMGVKAAGGVRSFGDFKRMIAAGATRIGASASVRILQEAKEAAEQEEPAL